MVNIRSNRVEISDKISYTTRTSLCSKQVSKPKKLKNKPKLVLKNKPQKLKKNMVEGYVYEQIVDRKSGQVYQRLITF